MGPPGHVIRQGSSGASGPGSPRASAGEARILVRISPYRQSHALARNCAARGELPEWPARITWPTAGPAGAQLVRFPGALRNNFHLLRPAADAWAYGGPSVPADQFRPTSSARPVPPAQFRPTSSTWPVPPGQAPVLPAQAGTGTPLIATLTTTTGQGAFRRQARATGPMPSGAQPALPSTSISAPSA